MTKVLIVTCIVIMVALSGYVFYQHSKISHMQTQLSSVENQVSSLTARLSSSASKISALQETIIPTEPTHALFSTVIPLSSLQPRLTSANAKTSYIQDIIGPSDPMDILSSDTNNISSDYWNLSWAGKDYQLQQTAQEIAGYYYEQHIYISHEIDCVDMSCDIWDILQKSGIKSLIAVGNLDQKTETFQQCNHAWLVIADSSGKFFVLEATNGHLYFADSPQISEYTGCSLYAKPSDLRADLGSRW